MFAIVAIIWTLCSAAFNILDVVSDFKAAAAIYWWRTTLTKGTGHYTDRYRWDELKPFSSTLFIAQCSFIALGGVMQTISFMYRWKTKNPHLMGLPRKIRWIVMAVCPAMFAPAVLHLYVAYLKAFELSPTLPDRCRRRRSVRAGRIEGGADEEIPTNAADRIEHAQSLVNDFKMAETIFESVPQTVVQILFLILGAQTGAFSSNSALIWPLISILTSTISIIKSKVDWIVENRKEYWIAPPPLHSWASLTPLALWISTSLLPSAFGIVVLITSLVEGINNTNDLKLLVSCSILPSFLYIWTVVSIVIPSRKTWWKIVRTVIHGILFISSIAIAATDRGPGANNSHAISLIFVLPFGLVGLLVLPSLSLKARVFWPIFALLFLIIRGVAFLCCCCCPPERRQKVTKMIDGLAEKPASEEEGGGENGRREDEGSRGEIGDGGDDNGGGGGGRSSKVGGSSSSNVSGGSGGGRSSNGNVSGGDVGGGGNNDVGIEMTRLLQLNDGNDGNGNTVLETKD